MSDVASNADSNNNTARGRSPDPTPSPQRQRPVPTPLKMPNNKSVPSSPSSSTAASPFSKPALPPPRAAGGKRSPPPGMATPPRRRPLASPTNRPSPTARSRHTKTAASPPISRATSSRSLSHTGRSSSECSAPGITSPAAVPTAAPKKPPSPLRSKGAAERAATDGTHKTSKGPTPVARSPVKMTSKRQSPVPSGSGASGSIGRTPPAAPISPPRSHPGDKRRQSPGHSKPPGRTTTPETSSSTQKEGDKAEKKKEEEESTEQTIKTPTKEGDESTPTPTSATTTDVSEPVPEEHPQQQQQSSSQSSSREGHNDGREQSAETKRTNDDVNNGETDLQKETDETPSVEEKEEEQQQQLATAACDEVTPLDHPTEEKKENATADPQPQPDATEDGQEEKELTDSDATPDDVSSATPSHCSSSSSDEEDANKTLDDDLKAKLAAMSPEERKERRAAKRDLRKKKEYLAKLEELDLRLDSIQAVSAKGGLLHEDVKKMRAEINVFKGTEKVVQNLTQTRTQYQKYLQVKDAHQRQSSATIDLMEKKLVELTTASKTLTKSIVRQLNEISVMTNATQSVEENCACRAPVETTMRLLAKLDDVRFEKQFVVYEGFREAVRQDKIAKDDLDFTHWHCGALLDEAERVGEDELLRVLDDWERQKMSMMRLLGKEFKANEELRHHLRRKPKKAKEQETDAGGVTPENSPARGRATTSKKKSPFDPTPVRTRATTPPRLTYPSTMVVKTPTRDEENPEQEEEHTRSVSRTVQTEDSSLSPPHSRSNKASPTKNIEVEIDDYVPRELLHRVEELRSSLEEMEHKRVAASHDVDTTMKDFKRKKVAFQTEKNILEKALKEEQTHKRKLMHSQVELKLKKEQLERKLREKQESQRYLSERRARGRSGSMAGVGGGVDDGAREPSMMSAGSSNFSPSPLRHTRSWFQDAERSTRRLMSPTRSSSARRQETDLEREHRASSAQRMSRSRPMTPGGGGVRRASPSPSTPGRQV